MEEIHCTAPEAARILGVERSTIVRWCQQGKLPGAHLRLGNRKLGYRIPKSAVYALLITSELANEQAQVPS